MKKGLTLLVAGLFFTMGYSQLPDGSTLPNMVLTDINGNQHDVQAYLNEGKTVLIDVFATWCAPCWTLHQNHVLENLHNAYGPEGTNEMVIMSIEGDNTTSHADLLGTGGNTQGNWVEGISFPIIEDITIPNLIDLNFWPTIFLIRPSGKIILANDYCWQNLLEPPKDWVYDLVKRGENDVQVSTTVSDRLLCSNSLFSGNTQIKNLGTNTVTEVVVEMLFNGEVIESKTWTGELGEFQSTYVSFAPKLISSTTEITFRAQTVNGNDDSYADDNQDGALYRYAVVSTELEFSITTDLWPDEISWQLVGPSGNILYSNADVGPLGCNQTYTQTFVLSDVGCHSLILSDGYGDGLLNGGPFNPASHACSNAPDNLAYGAISLTVNGEVLYDNASYGSGTTIPFRFDPSSAVESIASLTSVRAYPNPASDVVDLEFNLSSPADMAIQIVDINGKTLFQQAARTFPSGASVERIDVSQLVNGTYFIRLTEQDRVNTLKFTVIN